MQIKELSFMESVKLVQFTVNFEIFADILGAFL